MTDKLLQRAIELLDELHAELERGEAGDVFDRLGVVIAMLRDGYDPDASVPTMPGAPYPEVPQRLTDDAARMLRIANERMLASYPARKAAAEALLKGGPTPDELRREFNEAAKAVTEALLGTTRSER